MKTTITEEYEDGQLVRRTTVTEGEPATGGYVWPQVAPALGACTCALPWNSILPPPPPPCPVHGAGKSVTITCSTNTTPKDLAAEVGWQLREMA